MDYAKTFDRNWNELLRARELTEPRLVIREGLPVWKGDWAYPAYLWQRRDGTMFWAVISHVLAAENSERPSAQPEG